MSMQILQQTDVFLYAQLSLHYMLKTMVEYVSPHANRIGIDWTQLESAYKDARKFPLYMLILSQHTASINAK